MRLKRRWRFNKWYKRQLVKLAWKLKWLLKYKWVRRLVWKRLKKRMKRSKTNGDVRVVGMVAGTHVIEDLGRDVAYRTMAIIPEAQALMSKDLWRAVSQGFLFQVPSAPYPTVSHQPSVDPDRAWLEQHVQELEQHVLRLQSENNALRRQLENGNQVQHHKLDQILRALEAGVPVVRAGSTAGPVTQLDSVDGSAPTFLPSEIKGKDLDVRINIPAEESKSGAVSEAADRLRELRKKGS